MHVRWYGWVTTKHNKLEGTRNLACDLTKFIEKSNTTPVQAF